MISKEIWEEIKKCTVPIETPTGIIGTGFFITEEGHLLTCAHVVKAAGDLQNIKVLGEKPEKVYIGNSNEDDIAILKIASYQGSAVPLSLNFHPTDEFLSIGYSRSDFSHGASIKGQITDINNHSNYNNLPVLRLSVISDSERIEGGCSGSPVFDVATQCVVGIIAAHDRTQGALAIPLTTVNERWSDLQRYMDPKNKQREEFFTQLHNIIVHEHLDILYAKEKIFEQHPYEEYSKLFQTICLTQVDEPSAYRFQGFEDFVSTAINSESELSFWIQGAPGVGKTSFLNLLYWHLHRLCKYNTSEFIPLYINLNRYSKFVPINIEAEARIHSASNLKEQVFQCIQHHFKPLSDLLSVYPAQKILVL